MDFYNSIFVPLCAKAGKAPSLVAEEIGCSKSMVSNWKKRGRGPSDITLQKIAVYFGLPTDTLKAEVGKAQIVNPEDIPPPYIPGGHASMDLTNEEKPPTPEGGGLAGRISALPDSFQRKLADFLRLAQDNPETAERFLSFAVQELRSAEQDH